MADRLQTLRKRARTVDELPPDVAPLEGRGAGEEDSEDELARDLSDPEVQAKILDPDELVLPSEVFVTDWRCSKRGHVLTTFGDRPPRCDCGGEFEQGAERVEPREYRLRLAFTEFDIRKRKVFERIDHLRAVAMRETMEGKATTDRAIDPFAFMAGSNDPATLEEARQTLMYLAGCDYALVEGIDSRDLQDATIRLSRYLRDYLKQRAEKKQAAAATSSVPPRSAPGSSGTGGRPNR